MKSTLHPTPAAVRYDQPMPFSAPAKPKELVVSKADDAHKAFAPEAREESE